MKTRTRIGSPGLLKIAKRLESGKGWIEIRDLQEIGIRAIIIPIPRLHRSRVKNKRAEALRLFRLADTTQAKMEMVAEWNLINPGHEVSFSSLYRWDRSERLGSLKIAEAVCIPLASLCMGSAEETKNEPK